MSLFNSLALSRRPINWVVFTALLTSCTGPTGPSLFSGGPLDGIYSTRPSAGHDVLTTILRLKNPSLLSTAVRENGKLKIDTALLAAIEAEQQETMMALRAISPKIKVMNTYKLVLNGISIWAPAELQDQISRLGNVSLTEEPAKVPRLQEAEGQQAKLGEKTSVNFIGTEEAYKLGIKGQGRRVGIIDTGIDYTHKMFLGAGTPEAYKEINPNAANAAFPNKKVVGGFDFVGTKFNSASEIVQDRLPVPDSNPLDEATHGTHVAGTVAGIGDGVHTYSGVAPEASLYALKVFGAKGSTRDDVVIAALEYAVDPTRDLSFKEQLHVVNLSLGASYGNPRILYSEAIRNLVKAGTMVVASAGNEGDLRYVTGAPATADDSFSIASSIDNQDVNVFFPVAVFEMAPENLQTEMVEAANTKPLSDFSGVRGELIDLGLAAEDLSEELAAQVPGKIALIARGQAAFEDKIQRAQDAGAIAVIVTNSTEEPIGAMGGNKKFNIPAVMIDKKSGIQIREAMKVTAVTADLKTGQLTEKPWMIDSISNFSSRGPRSDDGAIKPEITGPGTNITSALTAGGDKGLTISGTSMSGPHLAGVTALLGQKFPDASPAELKSLMMGQAKILKQRDGSNYPVARQGAGRVQVDRSIKAQVVTVPAALSFGITDLETAKVLSLSLKVKNITDQKIEGQFVWTGKPGLVLEAPAVSLEPKGETTVTVRAKVQQQTAEGTEEEFDGNLQLRANGEELLHIPALVLVRKVSALQGSAVRVASSSPFGAAGSVAELVIKNESKIGGEAYLFNYIGSDARKVNRAQVADANRNCDLQSAGYRIIEKDGKRIMQFALKLYEGMTTWQRCEVNVQLDADGDSEVDQELVGTTQNSLPGLKESSFGSILLDAKKARALRQNFEKQLVTTPSTAKEDYASAIQDLRPMKVFDNSTLAIIEADLIKLPLGNSGELNIKISTTHQDNGILEYDDYLGNQNKQWLKISSGVQGAGYSRLPEVVQLMGHSSKRVTFEKGFGPEDLILYSPRNAAVRDSVLMDQQSQILKVQYEVP